MPANSVRLVRTVPAIGPSMASEKQSSTETWPGNNRFHRDRMPAATGIRPWFSLADFAKSDKYSTRQTTRNRDTAADAATIAAERAIAPEEHP
jgi:hypothetical protein